MTIVSQAHLKRAGRWGSAVTALLALAISAANAQEDLTVYYQVTYAGGAVRDLSEIPRTTDGIVRVLRISRVEEGFHGYHVLATGAMPYASVNIGTTHRNDLTWNGRAWVGAEELAGAAQQIDEHAVIRQEIRKVEAVVATLSRRLKDHDHAVAEAERKLAAVKGTGEEEAAAKTLAGAREARKKLLEAMEHYRRQLVALKDVSTHGNLLKPSGEVRGGLSAGPDEGAYGIAEPISTAQAAAHHVRVWKLPPGSGQRTYRVTMAHPEAGVFGAFRYVAYADTDGDGQPDRMIARSPLAIAAAAGEWTSWAFTTSYPAVYAGNAWAHPDTTVYGQVGAGTYPGPNWNGLSNEVYISDLLWGVPHADPRYYAYLSNIRVRIDNQNPDEPSQSTGSVIIVR